MMNLYSTKEKIYSYKLDTKILNIFNLTQIFNLKIFELFKIFFPYFKIF